MALDVLVLGDLNPDLLLTGDVVPRFGQAEQLLTGAQLLIGGSGAITAHGLARLGLRVRLLAEVGDDGFGTAMLDRLAGGGVDVRGVRVADRPTGLSVVLSDGADRSTLTFIGAIDADPPSWRTPDDVPPARHLHVSSPYLQTRVARALPALLPLARAAGLSISLDPNLDPSGAFAGIETLLPLVDLVFANTTEVFGMARALGASGDDVTEAARRLAAHGPQVAVKAGAAGALLVRADGSAVEVAGRPVEAVDTTGAGDSFDAGFLAARLDGHDDETCLAWADAAGRAVVGALGGTAGQPTRQQLLDELVRPARF